MLGFRYVKSLLTFERRISDTLSLASPVGRFLIAFRPLGWGLLKGDAMSNEDLISTLSEVQEFARLLECAVAKGYIGPSSRSDFMALTGSGIRLCEKVMRDRYWVGRSLGDARIFASLCRMLRVITDIDELLVEAHNASRFCSTLIERLNNEQPPQQSDV